MVDDKKSDSSTINHQPSTDWSPQINLGISVLMAENHRTGLVWRTFMKNPEAVKAMRLAGFHPD